MKVRLSVSFPLLDPAIARRDVRFHSNERTNACLVCFLLEFPGAVHVPVIGDCKRGLLEFQCPLDQVVYSVGAVEEGVLRVAMEMNKGHRLKLAIVER